MAEYAFKTLRGKDGLGRGDAKLLAAGGAWCGWMGLPFIVLIASGFGLLAALMPSIRKLGDAKSVNVLAASAVHTYRRIPQVKVLKLKNRLACSTLAPLSPLCQLIISAHRFKAIKRQYNTRFGLVSLNRDICPEIDIAGDCVSKLSGNPPPKNARGFSLKLATPT